MIRIYELEASEVRDLEKKVDYADEVVDGKMEVLFADARVFVIKDIGDGKYRVVDVDLRPDEFDVRVKYLLRYLDVRRLVRDLSGAVVQAIKQELGRRDVSEDEIAEVVISLLLHGRMPSVSAIRQEYDEPVKAGVMRGDENE